MKIMFLYMFPLWGNGSGSWLRALAYEMIKDGHKVAIVAPETRPMTDIKMYPVKPEQLGVFVGNPELVDAKKYEQFSGVELAKIYTTYINTVIPAVKEFEPEIIHAFHTAFLPPIARLAKILYGIRFIITTHGSDLHYLERDRRLIGLIKDAARVSCRITANSNFTRTWFLKMFGKEWAHKIRTITGGVYPEEYKKNPQLCAQIDEKYGLTGKKVVLFTGRLTEHKGVGYLIKAAKSIQGDVVILGDGPEREKLEKTIRDQNITNVHLLGYMNTHEQINFKAFYARADVYVAPSTWNEPLGLVILEAMAAKTPVIATRTGGVTSLIKDGYNGFLVEKRNATAIAEKVNQLLLDEELCKKMSARAHETIMKKYTWGKIAEKFERLYKQYAYTMKEYLYEVKTPNP
jgi:glycogen(starch) synthase